LLEQFADWYTVATYRSTEGVSGSSNVCLLYSKLKVILGITAFSMLAAPELQLGNTAEEVKQ